jgi:hypothetical protein
LDFGLDATRDDCSALAVSDPHFRELTLREGADREFV